MLMGYYQEVILEWDINGKTMKEIDYLKGEPIKEYYTYSDGKFI